MIHPSTKGKRSVASGIFINALLAVLKGVTGYFGNSYALIADAVESLTDIFSSGVVWLGLHISARPPDKNHPYGHGKAEPLATAVIGLSLLVAALGIAFESITNIQTPHLVPATYTLWVLVAVVLVKEILFRRVLSVAIEVESTAVHGDAWHHRSDAITSFAAFIGIFIAIAGGPGWEAADDWAALFASFIIGGNGFHFLRKAVLELSDISPSPSIETAIRETALKIEGVKSLDKCFVRKMGFEYFADLHVLVDPEMTVRESHSIAHRVDDEVKRKIPRVQKVLVHIEPFE